MKMKMKMILLFTKTYKLIIIEGRVLMVIKFSSYIVEFIIHLVGIITETQREAFSVEPSGFSS